VIYREAGQFKNTYASDQAIFPIVQDRWIVLALLVAAFCVPLVATEYWLQAVLIPFLVYSLAALGLNLLTGYAGQLSLGTGGFMAVGAYASAILTQKFGIPFAAAVVFGGVVSGVIGVVVGFPALRIKGDIERINYHVLEDDELRDLLYEIVNDDLRKEFEEAGDLVRAALELG